jgi:starch phosphorylase
MQQATGLRLESNFRQDFRLLRALPENLRPLDKLSWNYSWSWSTEGANIFRDLDSRLWEKCEQNPRLVLKRLSELRLWQKANDPGFVQRLHTFAAQFDEYNSQPPLEFGAISAKKPIAYFCAEYGVHNSLPIYSGGLGILAGDHLKSASDLRLPLVGVGLFYRFGYFRQKIAHDGWQEERYNDAFENEIAVAPVLDENGERIFVMAHMRGREVYAQAWLAKIGRISLYLLDTNVPQNEDADRLVTGHLYGGDMETRIVQEKILGIGGTRLLKKLGVEPFVYHLNEGHSAFLTLELAREFLEVNSEANFAQAAAYVREKCVFTTHTPVSAGNDVFSPEAITGCFDENYIASLKLTQEEFFAIGRTDEENELEWFGMTPLALKMSRSANGVSKKHGEVSRELWLKMFPEAESSDDVPITHITNGVHAPTWIAPTFKALYEKHIGANWQEVLRHSEDWQTVVSRLPNQEVWAAHELLKEQLIAFIRYSVKTKDEGLHETIHEHTEVSHFFDPNILTIGFARRVAAYKRWNLLLRDQERFLKMIGATDRPVQFVFAGKAHPQDRGAKFLLQNLLDLNSNETWLKRAVFIEDYDQDVARYLVQGVDVWLNVPRRPLEASGTSGQKAAMNGALNLSILDGWWIEGYNERNGWAIGGLKDASADEAENDEQDSLALYETLEQKVIPLFYERGNDNLPHGWIAMMKDALCSLTPQFSSDRMVSDYLRQIYQN